MAQMSIEDAIKKLANKSLSVITGSFSLTLPVTGNGSITIDLGKKPKFVIVYANENNGQFVGTANYSDARQEFVPVIITDKIVSSYKYITDNGFVFGGGGNASSEFTRQFNYVALI